MIHLLDYRFEKVRDKLGLSNQEIDIYVCILKAIEVFGEKNAQTISPNDSLEVILDHDPEKFEIIFCSLVHHLELMEEISNEEIPIGREFDEYQTVYDLFRFFSKKAC